MSWHSPKWERPRSSVLDLFLVVKGDSFYSVTTEDGQAAFEQVWGTNQHDFFPFTTWQPQKQQPQKQQSLQRATALMPEKGLLKKAIRH